MVLKDEKVAIPRPPLLEVDGEGVDALLHKDGEGYYFELVIGGKWFKVRIEAMEEVDHGSEK